MPEKGTCEYANLGWPFKQRGERSMFKQPKTPNSTASGEPNAPFPTAGHPSDPAVTAKSRKTTRVTWPSEQSPDQQLRFAAGLSAEQQAWYVIEIDLAFAAFLATDPNRATFCGVMSGVVMTAGMLYTALKAHH